MPVYAYKGVSDAGRNTKGTISAENARAARARMRSDGVYLTEIRETDARIEKKSGEQGGTSILNRSFQLPVRIPTTERALATRQLATLVGAGIPVVESLGALVEQIEHSALKAVLSASQSLVM